MQIKKEREKRSRYLFAFIQSWLIHTQSSLRYLYSRILLSNPESKKALDNDNYEIFRNIFFSIKYFIRKCMFGKTYLQSIPPYKG